MVNIVDLKTEYRTNPLGLDAAQPRFSWKLKSDLKGVRQTSWRIRASSNGRIIWDSKETFSDDSQRVLYAGPPLVSRQQIMWQVEVSAEDEQGVLERAISEPGYFEMGLLERSDWRCQWIEPEEAVDIHARKPSPYLRRVFQVKPKLKSARAYQSAHGLYAFWINGQPGTKDCFNPGLTSYYQRIQYQVSDITGLMQEGENVWAVKLGDGWWRGVTGGSVINNFGYKLHFFGQIELTYEDGSTDWVITDENFRTATGGLLASDMLMGDVYDAALEPVGWQSTEFDDVNWPKVHLSTEHADAALIPSRSVPVREKEQFDAKPFKDAAGSLVLDFGQNIAGYVRMNLRGCRKGQKIRLVHGEDIKDGCFSIDNINHCSYPVDAFQEVTYYCSGDPLESYCPLFSVFGFRYVLLEGYDGEIIPGDFTAIAVYSDLEQTGSFQCSNPLINKLVDNSLWSQKGNFLDVATDCPTRERNAWSGDSQVYVRTAAILMNVYPFFEKWLIDLKLEQYASGKVGITFPSTSSVHSPEALADAQKVSMMYALAGPTGNGNIGEDCAGWGDAAVWNPYMIYLTYGDRQILENQYESARHWLDYMLACAKEHNPLYESQPQYHHWEDGELDADYIYDTRMHYGEWQEPIKEEITAHNLAEVFKRMIERGNPQVATAYMARSAGNVAHMAEILGYDQDQQKYSLIADRIRRVYSKYLIAEDGVIEQGHQAAYVRALVMDLCSANKREMVISNLVKEIEAAEYHLNTGFLSTPFLLHVLVDIGREDLAFRLLEQTENPSWLHAVLLGSTTILESWDGMDTHQGSHNHYSYGAVCDFLFSRVAGIRPKFSAPGYKAFELAPVTGGSLTQAKAVFESLYGTIVSGWNKTHDSILYHCEIPVNTTAFVTLPDGRQMTLGSGSYEFRC